MKHIYLLKLVVMIVILANSLIWIDSIKAESGNNQAVGNINVMIEKGEIWTHKLRLFPLISIDTKPQIAVWLADKHGNFLKTIYLTKRYLSLRRPEALPHWSHFDDKNKERVQLISSATPDGSVQISDQSQQLGKFYVYVELNLSYDYNEFYLKKAEKGDNCYSGVSGQPSLIYECLVDCSSEEDYYEFKLIGHGSPDGSDGEIHDNLTGLTTALKMVKKISLVLQ